MKYKLPKRFKLNPNSRFYNQSDEDMYNEIRTRTLRTGFLTKKDFLRLARWKSQRLMKHAKENMEDEVQEITRIALSAQTERCRMMSLIGLAGVSWPMASVILHICHRDPYPILDVRALGVMGCRKKPRYHLQFWLDYVRSSRNLAKKLKTDMRTFDHNLFEYSQETGLMAR